MKNKQKTSSFAEGPAKDNQEFIPIYSQNITLANESWSAFHRSLSCHYKYLSSFAVTHSSINKYSRKVYEPYAVFKQRRFIVAWWPTHPRVKCFLTVVCWVSTLKKMRFKVIDIDIVLKYQHLCSRLARKGGQLAVGRTDFLSFVCWCSRIKNMFSHFYTCHNTYIAFVPLLYSTLWTEQVFTK